MHIVLTPKRRQRTPPSFSYFGTFLFRVRVNAKLSYVDVMLIQHLFQETESAVKRC